MPLSAELSVLWTPQPFFKNHCYLKTRLLFLINTSVNTCYLLVIYTAIFLVPDRISNCQLKTGHKVVFILWVLLNSILDRLVTLLQLGPVEFELQIPYSAFVDTQCQEWLFIAGWVELVPAPHRLHCLVTVLLLGDSESLVGSVDLLSRESKGQMMTARLRWKSKLPWCPLTTLEWGDVRRRWKSSVHTWSCLVTVAEVLCCPLLFPKVECRLSLSPQGMCGMEPWVLSTRAFQLPRNL